MDIQSKKKIAKQYDELVEKHGFGRQSLYGDKAKYDKAHQDFKFQFVMDQLAEKDSLLDVGCGLRTFSRLLWYAGLERGIYRARFKSKDGRNN